MNDGVPPYQRHVDILVKVLNLQDAKGVSSPGEDEKALRLDEEAALLEGPKSI